MEFDKEINPVNQAIELALNLCYGKRKELQRLGGLSRVTWPDPVSEVPGALGLSRSLSTTP